MFLAELMVSGGPAGNVPVTVLFFPHSPEVQWGKGVCSSESSLCLLLEAVASSLSDLCSVWRDHACLFLV